MESRNRNIDSEQPDASQVESEFVDENSADCAYRAIEIDVGKSMPTMQAAHMPLLQAGMDSEVPTELSEGSPLRSMIAEGMHFIGNAQLSGPCSVAGLVEGNLTQETGSVVTVVVTETGRVKGDITARKISVMGHTDGILDSGEGEVALHDTASVYGLVRYGRIQVNGADLNATLERVNVKRLGT